jgi:hypothetical protein
MYQLYATSDADLNGRKYVALSSQPTEEIKNIIYGSKNSSKSNRLMCFNA